ncbi:hypothetical protein [Streptomyces megasporus]|uniref:hypothetical protein n=1 Tax=Streptomyces megasporus TaxID=44060 RepID=UPI000561267D|nr:hypothetical protein [Streptomyces megasporus]
MIQRTMRTLGVAVLGVAFAAVGAGTAAADTLGLDKTTGGLLKPLPVEEAARTLPAPGGEQARTLPAPGGEQARTLPAPGGEQARTLPAPDGEQARTLPAPAEQKDPLRQLLGGLPLGGAKKPTMVNLPTGELTGSLSTGDLLG